MTSTLASLISGRYEITAYCETCRHGAMLDLDALARFHGPDARVMGSADRGPATVGGKALRCSCCKSCNTSIRIQPPGPPQGALPR